MEGAAADPARDRGRTARPAAEPDRRRRRSFLQSQARKPRRIRLNRTRRNRTTSS